MTGSLGDLTDLTLQLHRPMELSEMLQLIADRTAALIQTPLVSVRLLDPDNGRLLATCRTGQSVHRDRNWAYQLGEGLVGWIAEHAKPIRLGNAEADPRFLRRPDQEQTIGSFLGVPIVSNGRCTGVLSAVHPAFDYFTEEHEQELVLLAALIAPRVEQGRRARVAQLDDLTGLLNRRGLDQHLPAVLSSEEVGSPLSVALVDIDRLAAINDEHGFGVGNLVIQRVAELVSGVVRDSDPVARWGGEELLIVLPGAAQPQAERVAERARARVAEAPLAVHDPVRDTDLHLDVTVSVGVTQHRAAELRDELLDRATQALHQAKSAGRNRTHTL